jgi:hypothetical protein
VGLTLSTCENGEYDGTENEREILVLKLLKLSSETLEVFLSSTNISEMAEKR